MKLKCEDHLRRVMAFENQNGKTVVVHRNNGTHCNTKRVGYARTVTGWSSAEDFLREALQNNPMTDQ